MCIGFVLFGLTMWWSYIQKKKEEEDKRAELTVENILTDNGQRSGINFRPMVTDAENNSSMITQSLDDPVQTEESVDDFSKDIDDIDFGLMQKQNSRQHEEEKGLGTIDFDDDVFE